MSTTPLSDAVRSAIEQNLNGVVAGELQTFIENAKRQAVELERARADVRSLGDRVDTLNSQLSEHRSLDEKKADLEKGMQAMRDLELSLLKREAVLEAKIATSELVGVKHTMEMFLRNATVRETVVSNVAKPVAGYPGGNGTTGGPGFLMRDNQPDTTTTTRTTE